MANSEACELYIEQQIDEALEEGKTPYSIGQEVSKTIMDLFEAKLKPDTVRKKAERREKKLRTNVHKKSKPVEIKTDSIQNRKAQGGGKRKGSGRKVSQKKAWEVVEKKLSDLIAYMQKNCEIPAKIDKSIKTKLFINFGTLDIYKGEIK